MKKYLIADFLTLLRAIIGVVIFSLVFSLKEGRTALVLILFSLGELTDALDGEFARRYSYPKDRKYRWWRAECEVFDMHRYELNDILADLILGAATLFYIAKFVSPLFGGVYIGASFGIGFFVTMLLENEAFKDTHYSYMATKVEENVRTGEVRTLLFLVSDILDEMRNKIVVQRRKCYGIIGIPVVLLTLIFALNVHFFVKALLIIVGLVIGISIYALKKSTRLKEDKTPL